MNFRQLEVFRAVVMTGSASRASDLLGISQPAVSRSIADLEASLKFALFDRVRGRLISTPEGELFFRDVVDGFEVFDRLRSSAERIRDFGSGVIRIASLAALGSTLVPRAIGAFHKQHPEVAITVKILDSHAVHDSVASGQFDIGLAAEEIERTGVFQQAFGSFRGVCALPPDSELRHLETITPGHLDKQYFVALAPGDRGREQLSKVLVEHGSQPILAVETPNSTTVCALVLEGVGTGIVNPLAVEGFAERGVHLRHFEPAIYFRSFLLYRPDTQKSRLVKAMVNALLAARGQEPTGAQSTRRD